MGRLPELRPDGFDADQRELYLAITGGPRSQGPQHFALTRADGSLRGPFNAMLLHPELGGALQRVGSVLRYGGTLSNRERELAILLVAARRDSEFEFEAHEAVGRAVGLDDAEVASARVLDPSAFADREGAVARATLALLDGDLDDEAWRALR